MRIATTINGVGDPTYVLLHGLASTRHIWDLVVPYLAKSHRVIAPDLRGHGESEKPDDRYALEDFAEDVDELLRRNGVTHPVLVGHSFGANVALHHAATRGAARAIVLVDGALVQLHEHLSWEEARTRLAPPPDDRESIERFVQEGPPTLPRTPQLVDIRRSLFEWSRDGAVRKRLTLERHLAILRSSWEQDVHAELRSLRCPALSIVCRISSAKVPGQKWDGEKARAAARIAAFPRVTVRRFDDTIHDVPLQRPLELSEAILAFGAKTERP